MADGKGQRTGKASPDGPQTIRRIGPTLASDQSKATGRLPNRLADAAAAEEKTPMTHATAFAALAALAETARIDQKARSAEDPAKPRTAPVNVMMHPVTGQTARPTGPSADRSNLPGLMAEMREQANPNSVEHALMRRFHDMAADKGWTVA